MTKNYWSALPEMSQPRTGFNPCVWREAVYLCGSAAIEVFYPETETFYPLQLSLRLTGACCVCVASDQLVVHSYNHIRVFTLDESGQLWQVSEASCPAVNKSQNSQPVVDSAQRLFYIVWDGKCHSFNLETGVQGPTSNP